MKAGEGWNSVIRFDALKPVKKEELTPEQRAEHAVCAFANDFIDIFNTQPLHRRLECVAKLYLMVNTLALAAFAASFQRLPYVEPNRFPVEKDGKRLPLLHLREDKPEDPFRGFSEQFIFSLKSERIGVKSIYSCPPGGEVVFWGVWL